MATLATVAEVEEFVETDVSRTALDSYLRRAEQDVRDYISTAERNTLPVVVWTGRYTPTLGGPAATLTLPASILSYPWIRMEGTVASSGMTPTFTADTEELDQDHGTDTITPVLAAGTSVAAGAFTATIDSTGRMLEIDATATTAAVVLTRILGLQTQQHPVKMVDAVMALVQLRVQYRGVRSEVVGQYHVTLSDYHKERARVLADLIYQGSTSLAS